MKVERSPRLFCFQSQLVMVSQTRRWDKTKPGKQPGTHFQLIWTVCPYSQPVHCTACVYVSVCIYAVYTVLTSIRRDSSPLKREQKFHCKHKSGCVTNGNSTADMCCLETLSKTTLAACSPVFKNCRRRGCCYFCQTLGWQRCSTDFYNRSMWSTFSSLLHLSLFFCASWGVWTLL